MAVCKGRARLETDRRARAECTSNMLPMSVTLDVSKLRGWLNANAYCRVKAREYGVWGDVRVGRREGIGRERKHSVQGEGLTGHWRRHARSAPQTCYPCR